MNGRDEFQTGMGPDTSPHEPPGAMGAAPTAVQEAPGEGAPGSHASSSTVPPLRSSRSIGLWGYQVPDSVQNALAVFEPVGKQYMGWIGAGLLLIGLFLSAKTYSYSAFNINASTSQSLWDYGPTWSVVLLLLAAASAGLAFIRDYKWLIVSGGVSLLILILNFLYAFSGVLGFSARPSWGWIILVPAALIIMAAGAMRSTARDNENENGLNTIISSVQNSSGRR